ncbi:MAG TPA: ketoacyl-ACP synthase III [Pyrinomonadaceae bacterium]|nr:ketoacyl-ACP synthase III [Pyrinomonadaceae bacterium]
MAFIKAFGDYLPANIVTNEHLAAQLKCDADWIFSASGIRQRRRALENESIADMATQAGRACLQSGGVDTEQIGLLIVASGSSPRRFPGPAAETAMKLGLPSGVASLDVGMASAGALYAMAIADSLAGRYGNVLVIAAERMTEIAWREPADANIAILFGDGAGACLISRDEGRAEIVDHALHSDGSFANDLRLEHDGTFLMEGRGVILQASRKLPAALTSLLNRNGWSADTVDMLLMHQANQNLMNRVAQAIGLPQGRMFSVIEQTGNTSSASMLIAAAEWSRQQASLTNKRIAFAAFGAGFHWGTMLAQGV